MARSRAVAAVVIPDSRRWTEDEALAVLAAAEESGRSLRQFAIIHGLQPQRLERWRRELREEVAAPAVFHEITPQPVEHEAGVIELVLLNGRVLRIGSKFNDAMLRRLLTVVDEAPC